MKFSEAQELSAKLGAAFPRDWAFVGEATNAVYVEQLGKLPRARAALDAINALISTETKLPTVALVRAEYSRYHDQYNPPALPEATLSPEDVERNLRLMVALGRHLGQTGHGDTIAECGHPDCDELRSVASGVQD